jgi:hypothetical protein
MEGGQIWAKERGQFNSVRANPGGVVPFGRDLTNLCKRLSLADGMKHAGDDDDARVCVYCNIHMICMCNIFVRVSTRSWYARAHASFTGYSRM